MNVLSFPAFQKKLPSSQYAHELLRNHSTRLPPVPYQDLAYDPSASLKAINKCESQAEDLTNLPRLQLPVIDHRTAILAPLRSHISPFFETSSSTPIPYTSSDFQLPSKQSRQRCFSSAQLLSFLIVVLVLVIQVFRSSNDGAWNSIDTSSYHTISSPPPPPICRVPNFFHEPLPVSRPQSMSLFEEAKGVAAKFEYSPEDLNKGVKAFISQMRMLDQM